MTKNNSSQTILLFLLHVVHRDLKPANILVDGDRLCIADLGQARVAEPLRDELSMSSM